MMMKPSPDTEFVNINELDKLAKLLASENIFVEHARVPTASFDTQARVLSLPMWKSMKREVYHLLILHEIGHALYTDNDLWVKTVKETPKIKDIVNVIEDARIERMVKNKYVGSRRDFREGYKILHDQDFFGVSNKKLSGLNFIDRINIHFKLGDYVSVRFSKKEQLIIDQIDTLETLEEVVALATSLSEQFSCKEKERDEQDEQGGGSVSESSDQFSDSSDEQNDEETESDGSSFTQSEFTQSENDGSGEDENEQREARSNGSSTDGTDEFVSSTQKSMEMNISKNNVQPSFVARTSYYTVDVTIPYRDFIISYKDILADVRKDVPASILSAATKYRTMRNKNISVIDYLVKEFELRKAAHQYQRSRENKTGVINPNKLHAYSLIDDIFRKNTIMPNSKSHGIVFFLDFSGSMSNKMLPTIEQLLNLVLFCRKVNIPHRVYAFSDVANSESDDKVRWSKKDEHQKEISDRLSTLYKGNRNVVSAGENFSLVELFHNKMNSNEVRDMFEILLRSFRPCEANYRSTYKYFGLGGTPLDSATLLAFPLLKDFKKETGAQIVSSVFLTDGESTGTVEYIRSNPNHNKYSPLTNKSYSKNDEVYINPVTKKNYTAKKVPYGARNYMNDVLTEMLADEGYHTIAFRVDATSQLKKEIRNRINSLEAELLCKKLSKNNCVTTENFRGYAQYHFIRNFDSRDDDEDVFEVDPNATRNQIARAFIKSRTDRLNSRAVLAKFAEKVAA